MRDFFERLVRYFVIMGFFLFGGGALFTVLNLSIGFGSPIEVTITLVGLTLIGLGILAARIFTEVED